MACGNLVLGTGAKEGGLDMTGHDLAMTGDLLFDGNNSTVVLGPGTHSVAGEIKRNTGDETGCSMTFAGRVSLGGNVTLAGIATDFGSAVITGAAITINGASATSLTGDGGTFYSLTVANMALFCVRRWRCRGVTEGTGNTQRFLHLNRYERHRDSGRFRMARERL